MSPPEAPPIASSLTTACTAHIRELSKLPDKPARYPYRAPLCREFARFRLWTHSFDNTPPADGNVLDEVLEEAEYLKRPTVLLLASFASCLLNDCLRKVGNDHTRALLRLSLSDVVKVYPRFDNALKREWETPDAAVGELRECVDALFDVLSTLDNVMEEMKQDHVATAARLVEPLMAGTNALRIGTGCATPQPIRGGDASADADSVAIVGPLDSNTGASWDRCGSPSVGGDKENEDELEKVFWEEPAARPASVMGSHWEIYQQYIRDRFPGAVGRLDIEGLAKGNVDCYDRLMRRCEDMGREREATEEEEEGREQREQMEVKEQHLAFETAEQGAHLPPVIEESVMHVQTAQQTLERMKGLPSGGVTTTFKDSGLGSSAPHSLPPPVSIHAPDQLPTTIYPQPRAAPASTFLAAPPSVSGFSQSTICSVSSEPGKRRLLPRVPEHSRYGTGFECTFCGLNQRPITQGHKWRKHVFADLTPYMCIRARCPSSGTFYGSKKAWVAHDTACIRSLREGGRGGDGASTTTSECPFCLKNFGANTGRFYSHVAHHMEDIRLFALPPALREYEVGECDDGSDASSLGGGKSALAVYVAENMVVDSVDTKEWAMQADMDIRENVGLPREGGVEITGRRLEGSSRDLTHGIVDDNKFEPQNESPRREPGPPLIKVEWDDAAESSDAGSQFLIDPRSSALIDRIIETKVPVLRSQGSMDLADKMRRRGAP